MKWMQLRITSISRAVLNFITFVRIITSSIVFNSVTSSSTAINRPSTSMVGHKDVGGFNIYLDKSYGI